MFYFSPADRADFRRFFQKCYIICGNLRDLRENRSRSILETNLSPMQNSRRNVLKSLSLTSLLAGIGWSLPLAAQSSRPIKTQPSTGAEDRLYWANLLYKIAQPVISNLAAGTLKKNMPLETAPGYYLKADKVTYMEAIGRTLAGIAPWLALPDDDTPEGKLRKQLRQAF